MTISRDPRARYDVVVIGSGPNGLSAAIALARAQLSTLVVESRSKPGGGVRTEELTVPGYLHDVCSTVYPLAVASPFFKTLRLERFGLTWVESPAVLAHVLSDSRAVMLERSIEDTAAQLGEDRIAYQRLIIPFAERLEHLLEMVLGPLRFPSDPWLMARFGFSALSSMSALAARQFSEDAASALLAGISAHSMLPLDSPATASFALILLAAGHRVGWPFVAHGSVSLTRALVDCLRELGGELELDHHVGSLADLPSARAYVFDVTPRQLLRICGAELPLDYRQRLERFRYGPGVYKMDWALRQPIPWADPNCVRACTVHLSGDLARVHAAEKAVHAGRVAAHPFVLVTQPSLFDPSRAPTSGHTAWAYCHVPNGSSADLSQVIEDQIEAHAPGFRDIIVRRSGRSALDMERYNPNYVGGDINGGQADLAQLFFRPLLRWDPYSTPLPNVFLCSSSTPPGGGVHGMCGYWAAQSVISRLFRRA